MAVIAVILFHSHVPGFEGGFVGVDVFFVISGYLITQLLEASRADSAGRMLGGFYLRRIRRIVPALLVTCLVTAIIGVMLFLPDELVNVGKYLAATPVMLSNLANWTERSGYFGLGVQQLPLGHLWSISVEEQFYLAYPLLLMAISRYPLPQQRRLLMVLAIASVLLCIWASYHLVSVNYYSAPTRAWELLLGAVLALGGTPRIANRRVGEALALAGLIGILIAAHLYSGDTPYPGIAALLPCLGTASLLVTGSEPVLINRMLSWPPLVFVGLISYSLYLWHQPLLIFANYFSVGPLTPLATAATLAVTLLVAFASWRFVERPVRTRSILKSPRALLTGAGVGSLCILLVGLVLWNSDGFPNRYGPQTLGLMVSKIATPEFVRCVDVPMEQVRAGNVCNFGPGGHVPRVLVWGDSHALALMPAFTALAQSHGMHTYFVAKYGCLPLLDSVPPTRNDALTFNCMAFNSAVLEAIGRLEPDLIILDGAWSDADSMPHVPDIASAIEQTVNRLDNRPREMCAVLAVPKYKYAISHALLVAHRLHIPDDFLQMSRADALDEHRHMEREVNAFAQRSRLRVADPKDLLCPTGACLYKANGRSLYMDNNHLSVYGAMFVAPTLEACFTDRK